MEQWAGARKIADGPAWPVLLVAVEPASGGRWQARYSVSPGREVSLILEPGPAMPDPAGTVIADMVLELSREQAWLRPET